MMNTVTFLAAAAISLVASAAAFGNASKPQTTLAPTTHVAPTRGLDIPAPEPVMTLPDTVIVVRKHVKAHRKAWTCGAPRRLENDVVQTVRECEWK